MNTRDRFLNAFHYKPVDHLPDLEFGYWEETLAEWKKQGLPENINNDWDAERYFGFEYKINIPVKTSMHPEFEKKILEEKDDHLIFQDFDGTIAEKPKNSSSIPKYIKYPIESRDDWKKLQMRFMPDSPGRIPEDIDKLISEYQSRDYPLGLHCGSLYGKIRDLMGVEFVSTTLYDDRWLIEDIMETFTFLTISVLEKILPKIKIDYSDWWEDICYNHGPLIAPSLFKKIAVPRYRRIVDYLNNFDVDIHILDCDGNIDELIPLWLDAGINCMFPVESAHTDPIKMKEKYGNNVLILGAVDKVALIKGKKAIDEEIKRLDKLISFGGVIPHVDHRVPPDVTLENYNYYIKKKRELLGIKN